MLYKIQEHLSLKLSTVHHFFRFSQETLERSLVKLSIVNQTQTVTRMKERLNILSKKIF